jgi:hypothetical protein
MIRRVSAYRAVEAHVAITLTMRRSRERLLALRPGLAQVGPAAHHQSALQQHGLDH